MKAKFQNGDLLQDKITGLVGVVMVVAYYSTGCIHYGIQQRKVNEDGTLASWEWLDESRFELVKKNIICCDDGKDPGGPSQTGHQV